jgi:hypothetical protein
VLEWNLGHMANVGEKYALAGWSRGARAMEEPV